MTSTDLAVRSKGNFDLDTVPAFLKYANEICKTSFVPKGMQGNPGAVLACIMTGQEMGIAPMQALRQLFVVDGRVGQAAEMMRSMILDAGHEIWPGEGNEFTTTRVVMYGKRANSERVVKVEWNTDMVQKAGLSGKDNHKKYPRQMMMNRATAELARLLFPDVIAGMGYTPEELEDIADGFEPEPEVASSSTTKRAAKPARRRAPKPAGPVQKDAPPPPEPDLPGEGDEDEIVDAEIVEDEEAEVSASNPVEKPEDPKPSPSPQTHSRQIVKLAKAVGIDHHPVIKILTNGRTDSSNGVKAEEAPRIMDAIRALADGRAIIKNGVIVDSFSNDEPADDEMPDLPDAEEGEVDGPAPYGGEDDSAEDWESDQWRALLSEHGVKVTNLIRQAAIVFKGRDGVPPGSLQSLQGSGIANELAAWVRSHG